MHEVNEMLACVAGGIVSAREIKLVSAAEPTSERRSCEENRERDFEIPPARKPHAQDFE